MLPETINYVAILLAGIASMAVGFLWYSPILFGNPWTKLMGYTKKQIEKMKKEGNMGATYGSSLVAAFVQAFVLWAVMEAFAVVTLKDALLTGALMWIGFVAVTLLTMVLYEQKPISLFLINAGYQLVSISAMVTVLFAL